MAGQDFVDKYLWLLRLSGIMAGVFMLAILASFLRKFIPLFAGFTGIPLILALTMITLFFLLAIGQYLNILTGPEHFKDTVRMFKKRLNL